MAGYLNKVLILLANHHQEVSEGGIVEKSPSRLSRGEGVQKSFYILKIDLVGSTMMFQGRQKQTYLKLVHTYLSTVDRIAIDHGADPQQMEYAGDGLLAYFAEGEATAESVLAASCYMMESVRRLQGLDKTLESMKPRCKVVLHYAPLTVSRIGPRRDSLLTAIGHPIHHVSKLEKSVGAEVVRVTPEFYRMVCREWKRYLCAATQESRQVPISITPAATTLLTSPPPPALVNGLRGLLYPMLGAPPPQDRLSLDAILANIQPVQKFRTETTTTGYDVRWPILLQYLEGVTS